MTDIITTIHLSDIQREVLAKVKAAPNPHVAWSELLHTKASIDDNVSAARDVLTNLGLIDVTEGRIELTDRGEEVMRDENLIDELGELTDEGRKLVQSDNGDGDAWDEPQGGELAPGEEPIPESTYPTKTADAFNSLNLLKELNEAAEYGKQLERLSRRK